MNVDGHCSTSKSRFFSALVTMLVLGGCVLSQRAHAQAGYSCFPTCDPTDGRCLIVAGVGLSTFAGDTVWLGVGVPRNYDSLKFDVFDGETGGTWDIGTMDLRYTLYADPKGNGSGTYQVGEWLGSTMADNAWHSIALHNNAAARAQNGNHLYLLRVTSTDRSQVSSSAFKVRVRGTVSVKPNQSFHFMAPLSNTASAQIIYPNYPSLDVTTYDGTWDIYLDVPLKSTDVIIWDGDLDHGSYDGQIKDTNDPDTRSDTVPTWAFGTDALTEGNAVGNPAVNSAGTVIGGTTSGAPFDNDRRSLFCRQPNVSYTLIDPLGNEYFNGNPSGNREWERFRVSTSPFNRDSMDYHVDSLPPGIYRLHVVGLDLGNLDAFRFLNEAVGLVNKTVVGIDESDGPVMPLQPHMVKGAVFYDADTNGVQGTGEPGIPSVAVVLTVDRNADNVIDGKMVDTTDVNGVYEFDNLYPGAYKVSMDMSTLSDDIRPIADADGVGTANSVTLNLGTDSASTAMSPNVTFSYKRVSAPPASGPGTATRGYWVNHPENWPVGSLSLGGVTYTKAQALDILKRATKGDKTYSLAAQLIAAKLNIALGNVWTCIEEDVAASDEWLHDHPIGSKPNNSAWNQIADEHNMLDSYNNGHECAPHMD